MTFYKSEIFKVMLAAVFLTSLTASVWAGCSCCSKGGSSEGGSDESSQTSSGDAVAGEGGAAPAPVE